MKLQGIFCPVTTAFQYDGALYKVKVQYNLDKWNQTSLSGYVAASATGEGASLTAAEKLEVFGWVAESAAEGKLLIADASAGSVRESAQLANKAAEMGYKLALLRTPNQDLNLMGREQTQSTYFRAVADQSAIPVLIDNSPRRTGIQLSADLLLRLSQHPNIAAVCEDSDDITHIGELATRAGKDFPVLTGSASTLWPALAAGAAGAILPFANAAPYACITIWEAFRTREEEAAKDWQGRIQEAVRLVTGEFGIPALKHAMDLAGYYGGPPRLPLAVISPEAKAAVAAAFDELRG